MITQKALELYMKGDLSLEKAAEFSGMFIGNFLEYMRKKEIEKNITFDDFKETLRHAARL